MGRKPEDTETWRKDIAGTLRAMGGEYANVQPHDVLSKGEIQDGMGLKSDSAARERVRVWNVTNSGSGYNFQTAEPNGVIHWDEPFELWRELNLKVWTLQSSLDAGNTIYASHKSKARSAASNERRFLRWSRRPELPD